VLSTVYRRPSPADHTQYPALCTAQWAIGCGAEFSGVMQRTQHFAQTPLVRFVVNLLWYNNYYSRFTALWILSGTNRVSQYLKGKTRKVDQSGFTGARDSEWSSMGHMQICTLPQTDNHSSIPPLRFLQAGCPSCRPTNSVKALKATTVLQRIHQKRPSGI